ncbi:hypothetical protein [Telluribacter sp. SYSU D00476]|uniref:hypothetical protein n=1 Tax=Telluribacter sp. SYSU D00476 TaxID=2811430 RepID=UPI001FF62672|nr:hypothetical protein [Telluribacter sp. SYSU D00476]
MKNIVRILALILALSGCENDKTLAPDCVKAQYLRATDSPCGGPDKVLVLGGKQNIHDLFPETSWSDSLFITTTVPEQYRKPGQVLYFKPEKAASKLCLAVFMAYPEVRMLNVSTTSCR